MNDVHSLSASELIDLLRAKSLSSRELLQAYIRRVEHDEAGVNAVVVRDFERAMQAADTADALRAKGDLMGPLHGLPMTVKESFDVAGLPTCWGMPHLRDQLASCHADAVQRLVDAGAIVFGKTNVALALSDCQTINPVYGLTRHPSDPARTPGGSSGGSAAALVAGMTGLELGSDLGGSIRVPSHFCGVFGHKSSYGAISSIGHSPGRRLSQADMSVPGPMGRSAADLDLAFCVLSGASRLDLVSPKAPPPPSRRASLAEFRVAVLAEHPLCALSGEVRAALDHTVELLRRCGASVTEAPSWPVDLAAAHRDFMVAFRSIGVGYSPPDVLEKLTLQAASLDAEDWSYAAAGARAAALRHHEWLALEERRQSCRAAWAGFFRDHDIVLCPVHPTVAFAHSTELPREERSIAFDGGRHGYSDYAFWAGVASFPYLPATVLPVATGTAGLPIGLQAIGPYLEDRTTIAFAGHLAEALRG